MDKYQLGVLKRLSSLNKWNKNTKIVEYFCKMYWRINWEHTEKLHKRSAIKKQD